MFDTFVHERWQKGKKTQMRITRVAIYIFQLTKKQLTEYETNNPNIKLTNDLSKATHVICTKDLVGIDPESPTYTEGFGIFLQAMYQGKIMVNESFLDTQDSSSSILELFDER